MMKNVNYVLKVWMATMITTPVLISASTMVDLWVNNRPLDSGMIEFTFWIIGLGALMSIPSLILLILLFNVIQKKLNKVQLKIVMIILGSFCIIFEYLCIFGLDRSNINDLFQYNIFYLLVMIFYVITFKIQKEEEC